MNNVSKTIFKTSRLIMRNFADNDWKRLQSFDGKPEVARMMTSLKSPWDAADVKIWMKRRPYLGKLDLKWWRPTISMKILLQATFYAKPALLKPEMIRAFQAQGLSLHPLSLIA